MESHDMIDENEPESFDIATFWVTLQDLEDGSLSSEKREDLAELLHRSQAARRAYYEYFHQTAVLRMEADKVVESELLADIIKPLHIRSWWARPWIAVAAAAVIIIAAFLTFQFKDSGELPEQMHAIASSGTKWKINGDSQKETAQIMPGNSIDVISGTVKFELASGSILVMQAPCKVTFSEFRKPLIEDGLLWIDTGETDDAFEVSTSDLVVRDIGTRFGVRASKNKHSEIHLHDGGVNVISRESGIELVTLAATGKGHAISADGSLTELPLVEDPFPALPSLLSGGSKYRSAILSQYPISYVKFDGGIDGRYDNEVRGRRTVKSGPAVTIHSQGVYEDDRFKGFEKENKSIYLPANERKTRDSSVVAFLDGNAGISQQQGSLTFWIRQVEGSRDTQSLWLASQVDPENGIPTISHASTSITPDGLLEFLLDTKNESVTLRSNQAIERGKWNHIGITWGENSASIYLNGNQVAHRSDLPDLAEWNSLGNYVRFGKPTDDLHTKGIQNFHGWLDEFAIWDRALTPEEISHQYKAALATSKN